MATQTGVITIGSIKAIVCDSDPSISSGLSASIGSFASASDGSGLYYKFGSGNTDWQTYNTKATTGVALTFLNDSVYGTIASPETGNITYSSTNAKLGVTNIIIHNNSSAPTFASNMKMLSGSGSYLTSNINYIYVTYINSTEVIYTINQRT